MNKPLTATGIFAVALVALTGCGDDSGTNSEGDVLSSDYVQVCYDKNTGERVEDEKCPSPEEYKRQESSGNFSNAFLWYFIGTQMANNTNGGYYNVPPVGHRVSGGTYRAPKNYTVSRVPKEGAAFSTPTVVNGKKEFKPYGKEADKYSSYNTSSKVKSNSISPDKFKPYNSSSNSGTKGNTKENSKSNSGSSSKYKSGSNYKAPKTKIKTK